MEEILKTILYEWKERKLPETIRREKDLKGYLQIKPQKIIVVTGFRRVGKTYLIFQLIKELLKKKDREEIVYINFEDERIPLRTKVLTDLIPVIKQIFQKLPEILFLDEIQEIPGWNKWVRRIYDQERVKMFVTGSSSKMSSREIPTELRGRCLEIKIFPLSFKEFLRFKNIEIDFKAVPYSENEKVKAFKALEEYLFYGGMPEVVLALRERKIEILQGYYQTVIRRDIVQRFKIKNEEGLKALLLLLINSTSYSVTKLYNTLKSLNYKIGKTTLLHYLSYVENSYFAESVPIFSYKAKNQLQYPRKVYFVDNGFITALSTKFSRNFGRLYENLVFQELKRRSNYQTEIFYWKNRTGREVDFALRDQFKIKELIQVCYEINDPPTKEREIKSLLRASKELKCNNLTVINQDIEKEEEIKGKKVKFVPLWKWLVE